MKLHSYIDVKLWDGRIKKVSSAKMFAEVDRNGKLFWKVEGRNQDEIFMIAYSYEKEVMKEKLFEIQEQLFIKQQEDYEEILVDATRGL